MKNLIQKWNSINLISIIQMISGIILGLAIPQASVISILGDLFVGALRGIATAPGVLLVMSSLCHLGKGEKNKHEIRQLYFLFLGNVLSALAAVYLQPFVPDHADFSENTNTSDVAKRCC